MNGDRVILSSYKIDSLDKICMMQRTNRTWHEISRSVFRSCESEIYQQIHSNKMFIFIDNFYLIVRIVMWLQWVIIPFAFILWNDTPDQAAFISVSIIRNHFNPVLLQLSTVHFVMNKSYMNVAH